MSGADIHGPKRKYLAGLPIAAMALAALYVFGLHPASGMSGGTLFLLVGWAIPSLLPLLLALWAALSCRCGVLLRLGAFALVLVLASVNTHLPALVGQILATKNSEWQVDRQVERDDRYSFVQQENAPVLALAQPILPRVTWHGSERCMCLYLRGNGDALYRAGLDDFFGKSALINVADGYGLHFEVTANPDERTGTVTVQFRDQQGIAATFRQHGIPLIPALQDLGGDGLRGTNIATHGVDLLLHDNIVLTLLSSWLPSYFDRQGFAAFMDAATVSPQ
ncbi:hypothetical protein [Magnetospirillum gryphiswaldense]|nr:hypothetical protein [Magnetospirillum gryphiswaldense]